MIIASAISLHSTAFVLIKCRLERAVFFLVNTEMKHLLPFENSFHLQSKSIRVNQKYFISRKKSKAIYKVIKYPDLAENIVYHRLLSLKPSIFRA